MLLTLWGCKLKKSDISDMTLRAERRNINEKFPKIPKDEILQQSSGNRMFSELESRYRASLAEFKKVTENDCVKLVIVILSPEVGKAQSLANNFGNPFIIESCSALDIDCIDLTPTVAASDLNDITLGTEDVQWSKNGTDFVANLLTNIVFKYGNFRNTKSFVDSVRPKVFGDLPPNDNEVLDGEMNLPYRLKVNSQGLRMNHNLTFPKKKQTILFMGNSNVYCPYIDNESIPTELLQKRFPDKEIVNAAVDKYTMEDHLALYKERARYVEPDVVVVCTEGADILSYFFTQRNHYSRIKKLYQPDSVEKT